MLESNIFNKKCEFVQGIANIEQFTFNESLPEIAFWGRSNVGKSSLINALVGRKNLVKVSKTPGRTKEINFFNLSDALYLVDLPGYGYAKQSKVLVNTWLDLIYDYFSVSKQLKKVFVLIDFKVGLKHIDLEVANILNTMGIPYYIVFTKADKKNKGSLIDIEKFIKENPACYPEYLKTSVAKKRGLDLLQAEIIKFLSY